MRKLLLSPIDVDSNLRSRNLLGEPAILEALDGEVAGARRVVTSVADLQEDLKKIVIQGYYNTIEYDVDKGGELRFDNKEGIATFTSRGVQYKIRAIQEDDGSAWAALQELKQG